MTTPAMKFTIAVDEDTAHEYRHIDVRLPNGKVFMALKFNLHDQESNVVRPFIFQVLEIIERQPEGFQVGAQGGITMLLPFLPVITRRTYTLSSMGGRVLSTRAHMFSVLVVDEFDKGTFLPKAQLWKLMKTHG